LWQVAIELQRWLAAVLGQATAAYECVDGVPVPAYSCSQALREGGHWLWKSQRGHSGWFVGDRLVACVTEAGVLTGWLLATANVNERWVLNALAPPNCSRLSLTVNMLAPNATHLSHASARFRPSGRPLVSPTSLTAASMVNAGSTTG
jgi:hypothetical protein